MEEKDSLSHVETNNRKKLMEHLRQMVAALELSAEDEKVLQEGRLADPTSINRCTRAAHELQRCLQAKVPPGMDHMKAHKEQQLRCKQISDKFAEKFIAHITALFQNLVGDIIIIPLNTVIRNLRIFMHYFCFLLLFASKQFENSE